MQHKSITPLKRREDWLDNTSIPKLEHILLNTNIFHYVDTIIHIKIKTKWHGCHFADDTFKCIFLNENVWIPFKSSQKFIPKGPINNITALVQKMAWRRPGDKPLHSHYLDYRRIYASLALYDFNVSICL